MAVTYPDDSNLSPTDVKILMALTRELTMADVSTVTGIPYEYCKKRVGFLKKKKYIMSRAIGTQHLYRTVRLPETEDYFKLAETRSSTSIEYEFTFFGEFGNFTKHLNSLIKEKDDIKGNTAHLYKIVQLILSALKVRSFKKSLGQSAQYPTEERLREYLLQRIAFARKELALAEELYNARGLWSGDARVWQQISVNEPSKATFDAYEAIGKIF